jgi:hypothetical protein
MECSTNSTHRQHAQDCYLTKVDQGRLCATTASPDRKPEPQTNGWMKTQCAVAEPGGVTAN